MFHIIEVISTWGVGFIVPVLGTGLFLLNAQVKKETQKNF